MLKSFEYLKKISSKALPINNVRYIFEIGANKCSESIDFSKNYPNADIYPFECNTETIEICKKTIADYPRIHLTEMAVSDTVGTLDFFPTDTEKSITLHEDGNPGASSLFKRNEKVVFSQENLVQKKITVKSTTLKKFMGDNNINFIDILWLDAQGAELMILKGLHENISKVNLIQCEVEFIEEYKEQPLYKEIKSFLIKNGFKFCGFSDEWYPHAADAIFMSKKIFKKLSFEQKLICYISSIMPVKILFFRKVMFVFRKWFRESYNLKLNK